MTFRIRPDESVSHGLRRLAAKSLKAARAELRRKTPPGDEAIHEARKSVKKVRAIVQVIEADDGRRTRRARKRLRRINHVLSPLRDADAMLTTLATLKRRNPRLFSEHTFARVRRQLSLKRLKVMRGVDGTRWKQLAWEFRAVRASVERWRLADPGIRGLRPALRATHRWGRQALTRAERTHDPADFHEWRKQIKTLWYELRLLEGAGGIIRRHVAALHHAEMWLGDEHNAVVLCAQLSKDASVCPGPLDVDRLRLAADRYQCELRQKALTSARSIYRRKSRDYVRAIERAWKSARHHHAPRRDARHRAA